MVGEYTHITDISVQFCSVTQSCPTLCNPVDCSTPGFPSITNSRSSLKLISIESVMPSNHLILCHPLLILPQSFPASGSFPMNQLFTSHGQRFGALASESVLPMNIQGWFPLRLTGLILQSKGLSRVFSSTTVWKHQFFRTQPSLWPSSRIHTWLLPSQSLLCSPHNRPMNLRDKVLRQGRDFNWGVSQPRRW